MKSNNKAILAILIAVLMIFAFTLVGDQLYKTKEVSYSDFIFSVKKGDVAELKVEGQQLTGKLKGGKTFSTIGPLESDHLVATLDEYNVPHSFVFQSEGSFLQTLFPMLVFGMSLFLVFLIFRQMQGASGRAMSFGKSRAKMMDENGKKITFADVAGAEEAKEELLEIVEFLKDPRKFTRLGGRIPKGVPMIGPPGTGKTLGQSL